MHAHSGLLAADLSSISAAAVSPLVICSKCRSARISRSIGSIWFSPLASGAPLGADGRLAGRCQSPQKLRRQRGRSSLRHRAVIERKLARHVASLRPQVAAILVDQPLAGQHAQPQIEGHVRAGRVFPYPAGSVNVRLLHYVRRIDASLQPPVDAQRDHPPQSFAMRFYRLAQSVGITRRRWASNSDGDTGSDSSAMARS